MLVDAGCLEGRSEPYAAETFGSWGGRHLHRLRGTVRAKAASLAPPGSGIVAPVPPEPVPVYETKIRTWYQDRAGHRYQAGELVAWGGEGTLAVIEAAAAAEHLPRLTRPRSRRRDPVTG